MPIHEQPTKRIRKPNQQWPEGTPADGVPVPIHEQPTRRIGEGTPADGVPVPIHEQPTLPEPVIEESPEGGFPDESGPAPDEPEWQGPIHETEIVPENETPTSEPDPIEDGPTESHQRDDAVPEPIHDEPTGRHEIPSDGMPDEIGNEPTLPAPRDPAAPEPIHDDPFAPREPDSPSALPSRETPMDDSGKDGRGPGDDEKTGEWRRPDADDAPTGEWRRPDADDAPTGVWRPGPDDAPTARTEIITTLPDGSIVYGSRQQPFTLARADAVYWNMVGDTPYREAQILHNLDTGEYVVLQGSTIDVRADPGAATAYRRDRPLGGRWSTVRHNHPIGRGRVTPPHNRYPSMADMRGARDQANLNVQPQHEVLDVLTEHGPLEIPFGYDRSQAEPVYVGVPEPTGGYRIERFRNIFEYEMWRQQQLEGPG